MKNRKSDGLNEEFLLLTPEQRRDLYQELKATSASIQVQLSAFKSGDNSDWVKKASTARAAVSLKLTILRPMVANDNQTYFMELVKKQADERNKEKKQARKYEHETRCEIFVDVAKHFMNKDVFNTIMDRAIEIMLEEQQVLLKANQQ